MVGFGCQHAIGNDGSGHISYARIQALYGRLFAWLVRPRLLAGDADAGAMHVHIIVVLSTGFLMWGYATIAWFTIESWVPGVVGLRHGCGACFDAFLLTD